MPCYGPPRAEGVDSETRSFLGFHERGKVGAQSNAWASLSHFGVPGAVTECFPSG